MPMGKSYKYCVYTNIAYNSGRAFSFKTISPLYVNWRWKKKSQNKNVRTKSCQQVLWVDNSWCFNDIHMVNRTKRVKQMWCFLVFLVAFGWLLDLLRHGKLQVNSLVSIPCLEDQEQKKSSWAPTWRCAWQVQEIACGGTHVMFSGVRAITDILQLDYEQSLLFPPVIVYRARKPALVSALATLSLEGKGGTPRSLFYN